MVTSSREEIFPSVRIFEQQRDESSRCQVIETTEILDPYSLKIQRKDILVDTRARNNESALEKLPVPIEKISYDLDKGSALRTDRFTELKDPKWRNTSSLSSDNVRVPSSPEETSDSEIIEVRKDSALFLEEAEGFDPREFAKRFSSTRFARPRRESSGYSSNLGTFDEDRRNSSNFDAVQDFLKERRRSSAKRLNSRFGEEESRFSLVSGNNNNVLERMPTTEVHRKLSSSGLEMPDIEEVKELVKDDSTSSLSLENLHDVGHANEQSRSPSIPSTNETRSCVKSVNSSSWRMETTVTGTIASDPYDPTNLKEAIAKLSTEGGEDDALRSSAFKLNNNRGRESNNDDRRTFEIVREEESKGEDNGRKEDAEGVGVDTKKESIPMDRLKPGPEIVSRSNKVYRFISTQSEDRAEENLDAEVCPKDRRISLQITRGREEEADGQESSGRSSLIVKLSDNCILDTSNSRTDGSNRDKERNDDDNFGGIGSSNNGAGVVGVVSTAPTAFRKLFSPGGGEVSGTHRVLADVASVSVRPIYPYCPYSPYGSPQGSPRNRRRPLRESRRVSIDNTQGGLQLNQYRLMDNIGQGSYGIVKLAYNEEDETHYAMKILSKRKLMKKAGIFGRMAPGRKRSADPLAKVYREIALLKKLDHPNVVKLVEVLDDPDEDNLYLVFELVQKGEVLQIPTDKPLDEDIARKNFRDVVMGIEYLHYQRIVHRDIKPSNLLVDSDGRIKIADLGVSAELRGSGELLSGPAGTPAFAAPETTTPDAHYSGTPCDVWSMGVTLYSLVTGRVPWDGAGSIIGVQAAIRSEPLKFPERPPLSRDLRDLIERMLAKEPNDRISLQCLKEHVWLTDTGKDPLPSEADNCRLQVTVTDEEVERVVTKIPKLDTLILVKKMLKQHSFQNPFLPKRLGRTSGNDGDQATESPLPLEGAAESLAQRATVSRNIKSERFQRSGRSNSAPDSYDWQVNNRQISMESPLPPVTEASNQEAEIERR